MTVNRNWFLFSVCGNGPTQSTITLENSSSNADIGFPNSWHVWHSLQEMYYISPYSRPIEITADLVACLSHPQMAGQWGRMG